VIFSKATSGHCEQKTSLPLFDSCEFVSRLFNYPILESKHLRMFHPIPKAILDRMQHLEQVDATDRMDGTSHSRRLRQIPRETGEFIAILAASAPEGTCVEIGTSAGYSTLWLALACIETSRKVTTFELSEKKAKLALETFRLTGVDQVVRCIEGDAREHLKHCEQISFCFLDAEKDIYPDCYEAVIPRMVRGGLLLADNAISHREPLQSFIESALLDKRTDAVIVPVGDGILLCRKV
jgi:caffeoyl-CoA O-methyltransferase